ncbi:PREDICTED: uncharacterized protein LOC109583098 [Amphimedon queenslandica]|uniref:Uncharacterized protein n=1 Tax=Amphimedon queenslandica TaxID=400682 RepID=A0AAN0JAT6_AMPQE|nr:PREDICTED: uncharacterized protein LOC109583098 [Amphimedon queenslandica]|eukprot:XP_019853851.1 PREDICTED: uncharacterized protein LOC109583098 [Amphimedon queenslandica]
MSTASLPYQFTLVEGGEFRSDSSYGCISRREFCLVCACGECNGGGRGTTESLPSGSSSLAEQNAHQQLESHDSDSTSVQSQLSEATKYAGLVYYEEREDLVTFTAAKKLNALLEHIKKEYSHAKRGLNVYFRIASPDGFIELNLNAPQDELFTGWSIKPHMKPCRLYLIILVMKNILFLHLVQFRCMDQFMLFLHYTTPYHWKV